MKRMTYFVMAFAMVLGFTQCKKEQIATTENEGEKVTITLKLNNGSRGHIQPGENTAAVVYDNDDIIMVGFNGAYVGDLLTTDGSTFSGNVSISGEPTDGKIYFYYLDGKSQSVGTDNKCTIDISNQTEGLPVISYACVDYSSSNTYSNVKMHNQCALVKFNLGDVSTDASITLTGMKTEATIGFDGTVTNLSTTGDITTYGTGSTRYAVVLSDQEAVTEGTVSAEGYEGTFSIPTAAYTNAFLTDATMTLTAAPIDPLATPLTLEALEDGTIVVDIIRIGGKGGGVYPGSSKGGPGWGGSSNISMKYSVNGGAKNLIDNTTTIDVNAGDKVQLYGNGPDMTNHYAPHIAGGTAQVKVYGNIMSMLDEDNYATLTTLQDVAFFALFYLNENLTDASGLLLPATTLTVACYYGMFAGCTSLTTAPALPAPALAEQCYFMMFLGCTSLDTAPELPAETLAVGCYYQMFGDCTSLTTAPTLPAPELAEGCYYQMFAGCTSLTTAPTLPAPELASYCYSHMFAGCTSLTTAPTLPATTLVESCYGGMFSDCTSLTTAPTLPATTLAEGCYSNMFEGCTNLVTAPALPATTLDSECYYGMFSGCTSLTTAPVLPATTLTEYCYTSMFYGCTSLNSVTCMATNISASNCTSNWLQGVASTGTFTKASGATWPEGVNGIPSGWTVNEQ